AAAIVDFTSMQLNLALGRSHVIHAALLAGRESDTFLARRARLDRFRTADLGARPKRPDRAGQPKLRGLRELNG
ncbi:MAG: DNA-binding protein, partial [Alphaproteobacteria bacterium]|nr:DNA-binding protein [Alphaproteobacteria bacterium]